MYWYHLALSHRYVVLTILTLFFLITATQALPVSSNEYKLDAPALLDRSLGRPSLDHHHGDLMIRTLAPGGLYGDNNVPDLPDIDQTSIPGCGLISVLCALVGLDARWITSLIQYNGDAATTKAATFKLHKAGSLRLAPQVVRKTSLANARSDAQEGWWVGGVESAIRQSGLNVALLPSEALEIVTGRKAKFYWLDKGEEPVDGAFNNETAWKHIVDNAKTSPFILQSRAEASVLQERHAWWVVQGYTEQDGTRRISLWNPHGKNEVHKFDEIWQDCYVFYTFDDLNERPS